MLLVVQNCSRFGQPKAETLYRDARLKFERGELIPSEAEAQRGCRAYGKAQPEWEWRFRVLEAEVLVWRGLSKDALALLSSKVPPSLNSEETAVRQKIVEGLANVFLQHYGEAEQLLAEAEKLSVTHHPSLLSEVFLAQGVNNVLQSNYRLAEPLFRRALQLSRQQKQLFVEASALGNLGSTSMRQERYDEAIDWYNAALNQSRVLGNRTSIAKVVGNLGWCYYKMGDFGKALQEFSAADQLSAELGLVKDEQIWLTNLGMIYSTSGDYAAAKTYYLRATKIAEDLENKALLAICLDNLARLHIDAKQFDRAEQYNARALQLKRMYGDRASQRYGLLIEARIAAGRLDLTRAESVLREVNHDCGPEISLCWETQANLANVYVAERQPRLARREFQQAIATFDEARSSLKKEEYRLAFLTSASRFYNDYIDFLVSRGQIREALSVAEHSRARTLAEGLGLTSNINSRYLYPANEAQAQAVARQNNAIILYYWLKPERSYLWAITPQKLALFSLPGQDEIDAAVQAWRKALVGPRDPLVASNPALYEMLVAPAQKLIRAGSRVVIVADGSLHSLNFETLLAPGPRPHYWIEDVEISNANSLELLAASQRKRAGVGRGLLLIGDPLTAGTEFPPLARAEDEIQRVEDHFDGNQRVAFTRDKATATAYRDSQPGRFAYIHFVAHGTSSRISPLDSAVVLSKEGDAYKLYARDIVQQPLHANLVTISACYGAGERAYTGEGLVGLSWAFLRAGAHNVIGALWEVNDISTPQLMDTMYTDLQKSRDPAAALRAAKLAMLHSDSVFRRPFYWAPFQIYVGS